MATAQEVRDFLSAFRTCVDYGCRIDFRRTPKNIQGLATLLMTEQQAIERICSLLPEDYCGGPEPDIDEDGKEVWKFGCVEGSVEVYIKVRLDLTRAQKFMRPVIRSFHPAERELDYPLKGGGQ